MTIFIDNVPYSVEGGGNLLDVGLSLGFNIPYFCWHPALHSVGACRQCAVKQFRDENDTRGSLVMSCMTEVTDGMRVSFEDKQILEFRKSVGEWLMLNHPHDCPICDEGGECHLQDMIVMTQQNYRRTRFKKRTFLSQNLGPFIHHEMNRCIECYRCVRFYNDYAGGEDLGVFGAHDDVYFGRQEEGTLENPFSGNLVEICPTGVFTDKTFKKHAIRKWDIQTAPSVCAHCSLGCNTLPGERYGMLRRIRNRYNYDVNGYFLCDRGRFGYDFANTDVAIPTSRAGSEKLDPGAAVRTAGNLIAGKSPLIGIGSPRASVESNFALRELVGEENFYSGMSDEDLLLTKKVIEISSAEPDRIATLHEVESCDAVVVLAEDPVNTAPLLELAIRQSARVQPYREANRKAGIPLWNTKALQMSTQGESGAVFVATPYGISLDKIATGSLRSAPDDIARFAAVVANLVDPEAPKADQLDADAAALAATIADALRGAEKPLIVSGVGAGSIAVLEAASNLTLALKNAGKPAKLFLAAREQNSVGHALMNPRPLSEAVNRMTESSGAAVVVIENDLSRRVDAKAFAALLPEGRALVLDSIETPTTQRAAVVVAAANFANATGTAVNNEGRAQRFYRAMSPNPDVHESWRWIEMIRSQGEVPASGAHAATRGSQTAVAQASKAEITVDRVIERLVSAMPQLQAVKDCAPPATKLYLGRKAARQPFRYSGRTSMNAARDVREHRPPFDYDSPLAYSMEGKVPSDPAVLTHYWSPGWNSVQSLNRFQEEVGGRLRGGPSGMRVFGEGAGAKYFGNIPAAFRQRDGQLFAVPAYHIFGSEELSSHAPAVASRAEAPFVALNPADAGEAGIDDRASVAVTVDGTTVSVPARVRDDIPAGVAALFAPSDAPQGLTGWITLQSQGGNRG